MATPHPAQPGTVPTQIGAGTTAPVQRPPSADTGIDNFLGLMRRELVQPLAKLAKLATRMEELRAGGYLPNTLSGEQVFVELAETARHGATVADRLIGLGDVLAGPPIACDERVLLIDALRDAARELNDAARRRTVSIRLDDGRQTLAPVYGSTYWLRRALRHLMALLIDASGTGMHLQLRLRQVGFHQLLTGSTCHNRIAPGHQDLLQETRPGIKTELAAATRADHLDLALARALVEMHGGTLKTDLDERGILHEFHLTLPTGEPQALHERKDCANCTYMRQAEQFAQDIGELLNTLRTEQETLSTGS
jgi:hypothetical protein